MSSSVPANRPQMKRKDLLKMLKDAHPDFVLPDLFFVGIRGYYLDSMGVAGQNDRKIYDDAIFIVGKEEMIAYNANTDPSAFKLSIATLKPGVWPVYKFDMHKGQYLALCQRGGPVTVIRDGKGEDTGNFGINIHRGGVNGTGSLGCQTIPVDQFGKILKCDKVICDGFIIAARTLAKKYLGSSYMSAIYTYVLLENKPATAPVAVKTEEIKS